MLSTLRRLWKFLDERLLHPARLIDLGNFKIYIPPKDLTVGKTVAENKSYEPHVTQELVPLLQPGTVFLDIGANLGYYSLLAASLIGSHGKVIACEPNPDNCRYLKRSIRVNGFENIEILPYGAAEREGTLKVYPHLANSTSHVVDSGRSLPKEYGTKFYLIKSIVLDDVLADKERIDLIKMDIDGGEPRALEGLRGIIRRHRPVLFLEFCPELIRLISQVKPETFLDQINGFGYDLYILQPSFNKSPAPLGKQEIMHAATQPGVDLVDLVAYPPRGR
jgi:FkbM family methyltransferase